MASPLPNKHNGEQQSLDSEKTHSDRPDTATSRPSKDEDMNKLESHLDNPSPTSTIFQPEGLINHEEKSPSNGIYSDASKPHLEHSNTATPARQTSTHTPSPPPSHSERNIDTHTSKSSHGPQPSSQLGPEQPLGRYNAGVRVLRSLALPRLISHTNDREENYWSGGRYNAGVRAPRDREEGS